VTAPARRLRACVERWPEAETGAYNPHCCRFPKSCSATIYDPERVAEGDLEPVGRPKSDDMEAVDMAERQCGQEHAHKPHTWGLCDDYECPGFVGRSGVEQPRLAQVGDRIEHGQEIPANVVRLRDPVTSDPDECWVRDSIDPLSFRFLRSNGTCGAPTAVAELLNWQRWWPMTVVEVDPEPQPDEPVHPRPLVDVTVIVTLSDGETVTTHRTHCVWQSRNGLTPADVPDHVDEMVQRTVDKAKRGWHS
jgi:hypothetical protein